MSRSTGNDPEHTKGDEMLGEVESQLIQISEKLDALLHEADDKKGLSKQAHHFVEAPNIAAHVETRRRSYGNSARHAADSFDVANELTAGYLTALGNWLAYIFDSMERSVAEQAVPPNRAEMLLHFALPKRDRECMIGDLEEEYRRVILPKYGAGVAARWYWWQAVRSVAAASGGRVRVWLSFGGLARAAGWIVEKFTL